MFQSRKDEPTALQAIPAKANQVLKIVLCFLLIVGLRIWHLAVIQHDKKMQEAFLPRRKVVIEPARRGTIRDRFNIVLAANQVAFRASINYAQVLQVPSVVFESDFSGNKTKRYLRKEYVRGLSQIVARELSLNAERLEDLIYSHAAIQHSVPLVIKQNLTEKQYYRLKTLEKDWPGIQAEVVSKRFYPKQKSGCDLVGYMGPISKEKYNEFFDEIRKHTAFVGAYESGQELEIDDPKAHYIQAKSRLLELQDKLYSFNDSTGIVGIEASFEEELRGYNGKRTYFADAKGNALRELAGATAPISGKRVLLSISSELQEFAEKLLVKSEQARESQSKEKKEPVIRGGAIVCLEPNTGEVLALASYPRFDPNEFIRCKNSFFDEAPPKQVERVLETDSFMASVWGMKAPLQRELYNDKTKSFYTHEETLSWNVFLQHILPKNSLLFEKLAPDMPIRELIDMQKHFFTLRSAYPAMPFDKLVELDALGMWFEGLQTVQEKLFYVDLSRLVLWHEDFPDSLYKQAGHLTIEEFRNISCAFYASLLEMQKKVHELWKTTVFTKWRNENEKEFLKQKRYEEKAQKRFSRPYLDYIDKEADRQFSEFWGEKKDHFVSLLIGQGKEFEAMNGLQKAEKIALLSACKGYSDLDFSLLTRYGGVQSKGDESTAKDILHAAMRVYTPPNARSFAFRHPATVGSIFKLVTAYAALKGRFQELKERATFEDMRLFEMTDRPFKSNGQMYLGYFLDGKPIPQLYRGGRIPKSLSSNIGKIDLIGAIETSSNPYFSLLALEHLKDPMSLVEAAYDFGFGRPTGIRLPLEVRGKVPSDIAENRTGLYSLAIGQHTLLGSPLQCACMLASIANEGKLVTPQIAKLVIGKDLHFKENRIKNKKNFAFQEPLSLVGIGFPFFLKTSKAESLNAIELFSPHIQRELFLPREIRGTLLKGMKRVMDRLALDRSGTLTRLQKSDPSKHAAFKRMKKYMIGKTSTAETQEFVGPNLGQQATIYNHTWFGGISFENEVTEAFFRGVDTENKPELVVVVYLRHGGYGREVAPIAAQMVQKWRKICRKHTCNLKTPAFPNL